MSGPGDRRFGMFGDDELDADVDMLLHGVVVDPRLLPLARLVDDVRVVAGSPPPTPTGELAAALAGHTAAADEDLSPGAAGAARIARQYVPTSAQAPSGRRRPARLLSRISAMSLAAKAALGLVLAGAGAVGAGATGVLPDPAVNAIRRTIEAVTPFELPDTGTPGSTDDGEPAALASGTTDRDPVGRATAGDDLAAVADRPPHEAAWADTPGARDWPIPAERSDSADATSAPSTREPDAADARDAGGPPPASGSAGAANGNSNADAGGPQPQSHGSSNSAGGPAPGGGSATPDPVPPPSHGPEHGSGPPLDAGPPAGSGPPPDAGSASDPATSSAPSHPQPPPQQGPPNRAAGPPASVTPGHEPARGGPAGGGSGGGAPSSAPGGAQPPAAGPGPAPGH